MLHLTSCHSANDKGSDTAPPGPPTDPLAAFRDWCEANEARVMTPGGNSAASKYRLAISTLDQYLKETTENSRK